MQHMSEYFASRYYRDSISDLRPQSTTSKSKAISWLHFACSLDCAKGSTFLALNVEDMSQVSQEVFGTRQDKNGMTSS